jgi:hypothetical protein
MRAAAARLVWRAGQASGAKKTFEFQDRISGGAVFGGEIKGQFVRHLSYCSAR